MKRTVRVLFAGLTGLVVAAGLMAAAPAVTSAVTNPQSGSTGIQGTIPSAPPKTGATITTPVAGQTFTNTPITVAGLCPTGLLVKVFSNNVFVGSAQCVSGSFSIKVDLFGGRNDLVARVFDALDQAGPDSNVVTVTFDDSQFASAGVSQLVLTSNYARRGANPGQTLAYPFIISGGLAPYAISIDWGDGTASQLLAEQFAGEFTGSHIYQAAGAYTVTVRATDKNGAVTFLQVVGVANGAVAEKVQAKENVVTKTQVVWWPATLAVPLVLLTFWLGRRFELSALRRHLEHEE